MTALLSLLLLGLSGWLIDQHRTVWAQARGAAPPGGRRLRFARGQFWRRMISSSTIGLVGLLVALRPVVPREPLPMTVYLAALLLGCLLIVAGGVADAYAGARFYRETVRRQRVRQAELAVELLAAHKDRGEASAEDA
ncbi:MAG: hypothetical protein AAF790_06480 [Planctomycetota bacterium]